MDQQNPNQAQADPAAPADPALNPDLVGYPDPLALAQAHRNLQADANRRSQENQMLRQQLEQANALAYNAPRQAVPDRSKPGWYQRLDASGIPPEDIREAIRDEARLLVQEELQPMYKGVAARTQVIAKHPDYAKFESDIGNFLNSDPGIQETYGKVFKADPVAAFEWLYHEFGASRRKQYQANGAEPPANGAIQAAIPGQRTGDSRKGQFDSDIGLEEVARAYRENPNKRTAEAYAREKLHRVISEEHLRGTTQ